MKSDMEAVYFLTVREAEEIAEAHEHDENWDIWQDDVAIYLGEVKRKEREIAAKMTGAHHETKTNVRR